MTQPVITPKNIVTSGNNAGVDQKNGTFAVPQNQRLPSNTANQLFQANPVNPTVAEWIRVAGSTIFQPILKYIDYSDKAISDTQKAVQTDTTPRNAIQRLYLDTYNNLLTPAAEKYRKDIASGQPLDKIRGAIEYSLASVPATIPAVLMGIANIGNVKDGEGTENLVTNTLPNIGTAFKENPEGFIASAAIAAATSKALPKLPTALKTTIKTTHKTPSIPNTPKPKQTITTTIQKDAIQPANLNVRSPRDFIKNPTSIKQTPVKTPADIIKEQTQMKNAHPNLNIVFPNEAIKGIKDKPISKVSSLPAEIKKTDTGNLRIRSPQDFIKNPTSIKQTPVKTPADIIKEQTQMKNAHPNLNVVFPNEAIKGIKDKPISKVPSLPAEIKKTGTGNLRIRTPEDFIKNPNPIKKSLDKTPQSISAEKQRIRKSNPKLRIRFPDEISGTKSAGQPSGTSKKNVGISGAGGMGYASRMSNKNIGMMALGAGSLVAALPNQDEINTFVSNLITNTIKADSTESYPTNLDKTSWDKEGNRIVSPTNSGIEGNRDASGEIIYNSFSNHEINPTRDNFSEIETTGNRYEYSRKTGNSNEMDSPTGTSLITSEVNPNKTMNAFPDEISFSNKTVNQNKNKEKTKNEEKTRNREANRNVFAPEYRYEYENEFVRIPSLKRRKLPDDGSESPRRKKKKTKGRKNVQIVNYLPWLSEDDVEADNFSWLKRDLKPMRTPAGIRKAGTPAVKKAVAAYNAAVKAYNTARKKLLKLARAGDKPENKRAYAELKRLYKSAKSLKTAAQKQIKAYKM